MQAEIMQESIAKCLGRTVHGRQGRARHLTWRIGLGLSAAVLLVTTACNSGGSSIGQSSRQGDRPKPLAPRSAAYLAGVPVPKGFHIAEKMTDSYEGAGMRFARQEYVGYADPFAIREFYKEQMPLSGWEYITSHDIKGKTSIRFESSLEECTVTIQPTGFWNRTRIQVIVKPFKRSDVEPPSRRPMP